MLSKKQTEILKLAKSGGNDAQLAILDSIHALQDTFDSTVAELTQKFDESMSEMKANNPDLNKFLESVRGTQGEVGPIGHKGDSIVGPPGESIIGPKGDVGERGPQGFRGETGFSGVDGHTPTPEEISALIPAPIPGKDGSPDTPEDIVVKLESLQGDARLGRASIKELDDLEKNWDAKLEAGLRRVTPRSSNAIRFQDLSSQTNGTLKIFSVQKGMSGVLFSSDFPTVLMEGNGFTLNATRTQLTMTTVTAPSSGSQLLYMYSSLFNLS